MKHYYIIILFISLLDFCLAMENKKRKHIHESQGLSFIKKTQDNFPNQSFDALYTALAAPDYKKVGSILTNIYNNLNKITLKKNNAKYEYLLDEKAWFEQTNVKLAVIERYEIYILIKNFLKHALKKQTINLLKNYSKNTTLYSNHLCYGAQLFFLHRKAAILIKGSIDTTQFPFYISNAQDLVFSFDRIITLSKDIYSNFPFMEPLLQSQEHYYKELEELAAQRKTNDVQTTFTKLNIILENFIRVCCVQADALEIRIAKNTITQSIYKNYCTAVGSLLVYFDEKKLLRQ